MRHLFILCAVVLACALLTMGDEQAPRRPTSPAAVKAMNAYESSVKNAAEEYARKAQAAGDVAVRALEDAKKVAVHHEDLDEANAITAAIQQIRDANPAPPTMLGAPTGIWHIAFMNGANRVYRVSPDGSVAWEENGRPGGTRPRLRRTNAGFTVEFKPNEIDRITFVGDRLYDDNFSPISDFPTKKPSTMGLGTR